MMKLNLLVPLAAAAGTLLLGLVIQDRIISSQRDQIAAMEITADLLTQQLDKCSERVSDLKEDLARDRKIDAIPDLGLPGYVKPGWLLPY